MENVIESTGIKALNLSPETAEQINTIVDFKEITDPYADLESEYFIGIRIDIESFRLISNLKSIAESPPPSIAPDTTTSEAQALLIDIYKKYPTKAFELYVDNRLRPSWDNSGIEWQYQGEATIQNRGISYPIPLIPFLSGTEIDLVHPVAIGCRVPSGLGEFDKISVRISWLLRISLIKKSPQKAITPINFGLNVGFTPVMVRSFSPNRKILFLQNTGINRIWFAFLTDQPANSFALINNSLYLDPGGSFSYEAGKYDIPLQIWAACEENKASRIVGQEIG